MLQFQDVLDQNVQDAIQAEQAKIQKKLQNIDEVTFKLFKVEKRVVSKGRYHS